MSEELQVFPCGHYFCDACAQMQLAQPQPSCPYCRARLSKNSVFRVCLAGSGCHQAEVHPPEGPVLNSVKVTGVWMTKLEALLRRLLLLRDVSPGIKSLVFSQFPDALALASKALDVVQIRHVSLGLGGGKDTRLAVRAAIRAFSEDPDVRVFLLSLRAGAAGLTLTAASRVFLLEPGLDPAIEQQAVARVHRIGQEQEVVITRLLVQGSVEEQVLRISETKQALLAEAAHQHQQQQQQHVPGSSSDPAAAAAGKHGAAAAAATGQVLPAEGAEDIDMLEEDAEEEDVTDVTTVTTPGGSCRRRSGSGGPALGGAGIPGDARSLVGGSAGYTRVSGDTRGPTTLQSLAPKKEAVGREEVAGLLAAVMKQRARE